MNYFNEHYFTPQYWVGGYFDGFTGAPEQQEVYPGLFGDADAIFPPVVSAEYEIAAQLFLDLDAILVPSVSSWREVEPQLFADQDVFYVPIVSVPYDQELQAALFSDRDVFYRPYAFGKVTMGRYTIVAPATVRSAEHGDAVRMIEYPDVFSKEEN